jgi:hypothetical protein
VKAGKRTFEWQRTPFWANEPIPLQKNGDALVTPDGSELLSDHLDTDELLVVA